MIGNANHTVAANRRNQVVSNKFRERGGRRCDCGGVLHRFAGSDQAATRFVTHIMIGELARTTPGQKINIARGSIAAVLGGGFAASPKSQPREPGLRPAFRAAFFGGGATVRLRPRPIFFARLDRVAA